MTIALSGKCCSGKNYVSEIFRKRGFYIIDVDLISHRIFSESTDEIISSFGDSILSGGVIDRKKLGDIVFSNPEKREVLEGIIHPGVYKEIFNLIENNSNTVINIPLLTSDELVSKCDLIVWISSPLYLRFIRALKRDHYSILTVIRRIISQMKLNVKHFYWDVDIKSIRNGFFKNVDKEVDNLLNQIGRG